MTHVALVELPLYKQNVGHIGKVPRTMSKQLQQDQVFRAHEPYSQIVDLRETPAREQLVLKTGFRRKKSTSIPRPSKVESRSDQRHSSHSIHPAAGMGLGDGVAQFPQGLKRAREGVLARPRG